MVVVVVIDCSLFGAYQSDWLENVSEITAVIDSLDSVRSLSAQ